MTMCLCDQLLSHVWFFVTLWTVALQAPLSMGFSRSEYWSGLPFPPPADFSPVTTSRMFWKPFKKLTTIYFWMCTVKCLQHIFNWKTIALQCCIGFSPTLTQISHISLSVIYIYIYISSPSWASIPLPPIQPFEVVTEH